MLDYMHSFFFLNGKWVLKWKGREKIDDEKRAFWK